MEDVMKDEGIDIKEVRIVKDEEDEIVEEMKELREKYDYVLK